MAFPVKQEFARAASRSLETRPKIYFKKLPTCPTVQQFSLLACLHSHETFIWQESTYRICPVWLIRCFEVMEIITTLLSKKYQTVYQVCQLYTSAAVRPIRASCAEHTIVDLKSNSLRRFVYTVTYTVGTVRRILCSCGRALGVVKNL